MTKYGLRFFGRKLSKDDRKLAEEGRARPAGSYTSIYFSTKKGSRVIIATTIDDYTENTLERREYIDGQLSSLSLFDNGNEIYFEEHLRPGSILVRKTAAPKKAA